MKNKPRILGITLARGGSKSVPRKNIKLINGKPVIAYTIQEAQKSKYISHYIVSTDDNEIKAVAEQFGAEVPFLRPTELAKDTTSSVDALQHAVTFMEKQNKLEYDYVVELMCTNPLKNVQDIDRIIEKLITTNADSVIGVMKLDEHHPARAKKIVDDFIVDFCVPELSGRRQDLKPEAYIRNGSIYALNRNKLMLDGVRFGSENSRPYIMPPERSINIDSDLDFYLAEYLITKR